MNASLGKAKFTLWEVVIKMTLGGQYFDCLINLWRHLHKAGV